MGALFQPINQVKFTNVAIVKYKHKGKKFEIACYKNKIIDWRNGIELNIDDVLQSHLIFTNISKGEIAKKSELNSCFNSDNNYEICKTILEKGMVRNIGYSINIDDSAKKQALKVFDILSKEYNDVIQRAFMRIQIICDDIIRDDVVKFLNSNNVIIEEQNLTNNIKREELVDSQNNHMYDEHVDIEKNKEIKNGMCPHNTKKNHIDLSCESSQINFKKNIEFVGNPCSIDCTKNSTYNNIRTEIEKEYHDDENDDRNKEIRQKDTCSEDENNLLNLITNGKNISDESIHMTRSNEDEHKNDKEEEEGEDEEEGEEGTNRWTNENYANEKEKSVNILKSDKKEINDLLDVNLNVEIKGNKQNDTCLQNNEKRTNELIRSDDKVKTKQKRNKHEKERNGRKFEIHKIVFLCYPCVYKFVDAFTKKYKKNCSSKILNNNVKIASANKKKKNTTENSINEADDVIRRKTKANGGNIMMDNNLNSDTNGKVIHNKNSIRSSSNHRHDAKKPILDASNINNNGGDQCNYQNDDKNEVSSTVAHEQIKEEPNDKRKSETVIMCTSCLTKIEKSNYKVHCRSDFHVYNVKRKYKKLPPITLEEYIEIDFDVAHFHVDM
ncbi:ribosome maturation protein SBDS [Plasmodium gonderi]|uniref:Ribosome maturation protein SBDS n=1 Tax=Plasmodium gonderi TaxID=77519 RepID=A0A1Y1JPB8_PLAGO|nr:ribosome maturation protein SBDS [Plasmodium gonderi]GAW83107.1 ribosome maturation protein SBDS [Plasmodium gonderi]